MSKMPGIEPINSDQPLDPKIEAVADLLNLGMQRLINANFIDKDHIKIILVDKKHGAAENLIGPFITPPNETQGFALVQPVSRAFEDRESMIDPNETAYTILSNFAAASLSFFVGGEIMNVKMSSPDDPKRRQHLISDWMWLITYFSAIADVVPENILSIVEEHEQPTNQYDSEMTLFKQKIADSIGSASLEESALNNRLKSLSKESLIMFSFLCIKLGILQKDDFYKEALDLFQEPAIDKGKLNYSIFD